MSSTNGDPVTRAEFRTELRKLQAEFRTGLAKCATKKDLKDLDARVARLATQVMRNSEEVEDIRQAMATKGDIDRIMTMLDAIMAEMKVWGNKLVVHDHRLDQLEKRCPQAGRS